MRYKKLNSQISRNTFFKIIDIRNSKNEKLKNIQIDKERRTRKKNNHTKIESLKIPKTEKKNNRTKIEPLKIPETVNFKFPKFFSTQIENLSTGTFFL